ncbi:acyl-CoA thioesterase [Verrucomicrobia bacterium LW23]|nr:acyl-CoA thioesterase [Verrucomicrobia bacterium LW23]
MSDPESSPAAETHEPTPPPVAESERVFGATEIVVPVRLYYFDTDAAGVVHNVAYLRLIEVARSDLAAQMGWTLAEMHATGCVPVLTRTEIDYVYPARMGDAAEIYGALQSFDRVRFQFYFEMREPAAVAATVTGRAPRVFVRCNQTLATLKMPEGKLLPTPESWRKAYPHLYLQRKKA